MDKLVNADILDDDFENVIDDFSKSWKDLRECHGTTVPNKVHIIQAHLSDYLKKTKTTFKNKSDQVVESTHQEYFSRMKSSNYIVKNFKSEKHGLKMLKGTMHFNSYNVGYGI